MEVVSPPITVIAKPFEIKPDDDFDTASGISAKIVAKAVIKIGRSRTYDASMMDSCNSNPCFRFVSTRSSKTMAFATTTPMSMSIPIIALIESG